METKSREVGDKIKLTKKQKRAVAEINEELLAAQQAMRHFSLLASLARKRLFLAIEAMYPGLNDAYVLSVDREDKIIILEIRPSEERSSSSPIKPA